MAYCLKCRAKLEDDDIVCPFCGGETGGRGSLKQLSDNFILTARTVFATKDETEDMDPYDRKNRVLPTLFAYFLPIPFLFIPILVGKNSEYTKFHANQGLLLLLASIFSMVTVFMACFALEWIPVIGEILSALLKALWAILIVIVYGIAIRNVLLRRARTLPIIGRFRLLR